MLVCLFYQVHWMYHELDKLVVETDMRLAE